MGKLSKDRRDIYYRKAKEEGYRARSAFKLIQIDNQFMLFASLNDQDKNYRVVDLCAAPGSWSQVIRDRLYTAYHSKLEKKVNMDPPLIVAVDLQDMAPIENVIQIKGDITSKDTIDQILSHFKGSKAHIVFCDGAPDITGMHDVDEYIQSQLLFVALRTSAMLLQSGGTFVAKIFRGEYIGLLYSQLKLFFSEVYCCKPASSRMSSFEAFVVCFNFKHPECLQSMEFLTYTEFQSFTLNRLSHTNDSSQKSTVDSATPNNIDIPLLNSLNRTTVPFIACGDLQGFDSDTAYPLSSEYVSYEPVQPPIDPPYQDAIKLKRGIY